MSDPDRYYPADEDRAGYEMPDPRPGEDDVEPTTRAPKTESAEEMLDRVAYLLERAPYLPGTPSETPDMNREALRFVLDTRADLLAALKSLRKWSREEYQNSPAVDAQADAAIANAEGK